MEDKNKLIIIILGVISAVMGVLALLTIQSSNIKKQNYEKQVLMLRQENDDLSSQMSRARKDIKTAQAKLDGLQKELETILIEKDDWKNKYGLALQEKDSLVEKIAQLDKKSKAVKSAIDIIAEPVKFDDSYWASVLQSKAELEITLTDLNNEIDEREIQLAELSKTNNELNLELKGLKEIRSDLERRITYGAKLAQTLSEELVREKKDRGILVENLDKLRQDYHMMRQELKVVTGEKISLSKEARNLREEREILNRKVAEMDQVLQDRMTEIMTVKDQLTNIRWEDTNVGRTKDSKIVQLPPIVVRADSSGEFVLPERLSGNILAVNQDNNFVVIDIGASSGVKVGMSFGVYRNNNQIGTIKVIQVRQDIAAADIKNLKSGQYMKLGDIVK